jgi:hypothetical protein
MPPSADEVVILEEAAYLRTHETDSDAPTWAGSTECSGSLVLSNRRLTFTSRFDEWDDPIEPSAVVDEALGSIKQISVKTIRYEPERGNLKGGTEQILALETRDGNYEFRFEGSDPNEWIDLIGKAREHFLATALGTAPAPRPTLIRIRCSFCHSVYDDALGKCPNCGARHP